MDLEGVLVDGVGGDRVYPVYGKPPHVEDYLAMSYDERVQWIGPLLGAETLPAEQVTAMIPAGGHREGTGSKTRMGYLAPIECRRRRPNCTFVLSGRGENNRQICTACWLEEHCMECDASVAGTGGQNWASRGFDAASGYFCNGCRGHR